MAKLLVIAVNTYKEAIRDKVFYSLLIFAVIMLCFSMVLGNLTIGQPQKIIKDFGLATISIFGTLVAIYVGIGSIYKEVDKRTIYVVLAKPVTRGQFLFGKYLGVSMMVTINIIVMSLALFGLLIFVYGETPWRLFLAIVPIWFEIHLVLAVALLFSAFSTPFLSGLFTLSVFVIGHLTQDFIILVRSSDDVLLKNIAQITYYVFPNLESLNYTTQVVHDLAFPIGEVIKAIVYSCCYTAMILYAGMLIFSRRDFK